MARIVVVEDDAQIRALIEKLLASDGHLVAATGDPTRAVSLVREHGPDLVLCDIGMPEMDGYAVLRALQDDPETAGVPVAFLTGHREFTERVKAFRFGVVDYLTKPFSRQMLLRKVERLIASLEKRSGQVAAEGTAARDLVEELQRDARTGLLSVETPRGEVVAPMRSGEVQGELPENPSRASFEEIDAAREDLAQHDPSRLAPGGPMPRFDDVPSALRTVLVVDDNADMRRLLVRLLQAQGFTVHEAGEGETALALALAERPRLILADVRMPGLSGFELCRRVRAHSLIRRTPFLFLSGWDDYDVRQEGLDVGADDFLSKQSSLREILIRIHLLLKRYAALASPGAAALSGRLDMLGAPDVLQVCHLNRLTGVLRIEDGGRRLSFRFRDGAVIDADRDGARAALFAFLSWDRGHFAFEPGDPGDGAPLEDSFGNLLLEGCRVLDEQRRTAIEGGTP